jgi:Mce-associated membrane protein
VVQAGVTRLSGDTAQLLVFLDQLIVRKDTPAGTSAAAQLSVTARLDSGHWRIIDIHAR